MKTCNNFLKHSQHLLDNNCDLSQLAVKHIRDPQKLAHVLLAVYLRDGTFPADFPESHPAMVMARKHSQDPALAPHGRQSLAPGKSNIAVSRNSGPEQKLTQTYAQREPLSRGASPQIGGMTSSMKKPRTSPAPDSRVMSACRRQARDRDQKDPFHGSQMDWKPRMAYGVSEQDPGPVEEVRTAASRVLVMIGEALIEPVVEARDRVLPVSGGWRGFNLEACQSASNGEYGGLLWIM